MKFAVIFLVFITNLPVLAVAASSYQNQARVFYIDADKDIGPVRSIERTVIGISNTYYFHPVEYNNYPYAEAAFFARSSSVTFRFERSELKSDYFFIGDESTDEKGVGLSYIPKGKGYLYNLDYSTSDNADSYSLGFGKFLSEHSLISLDYYAIEGDEFANTELKGLELFYKYAVSSVGERNWGLKAGVDLQHNESTREENTDIFIELDYFFDRKMGVSLLFDDSSSKGFYGEYFVRPNFGLSVGYLNGDYDSLLFAGKIRF